MNIDDLKATWLEYDNKLQASATLNERMINSMITERSRSRVAGIQREFARGAALTTFWLVAIIAVLVGNPFDYKNTMEYAPVFLMALSFVGILLLIATASTGLRRVDINQQSVANAINQVIKVYHKPRRFLKLTVMVMFSAGLMFPLSFLPRKIEKVGMGSALVDTLIPMAISIVLYVIAAKLGAFRDRHIEGLKGDLEELRALTADLE